MAEQDILFEVDKKGIALLTFNRPEKLNAISTEMLKRLPGILRQIKDDDSIKVAIITGTGRGFCSGADVGDRLAKITEGDILLCKEDVTEPVGYFVTIMPSIYKPMIAAVNGVCVGIGFSTALLCDIRIASEKAKFSSIFVKRGLMPDGCMTFTLPNVVGVPRALEMMMTGRIVEAEEAAQMGLVNKLVPHEKLMEESYALAEQMTKVAPIALSFAKRAVWNMMLDRFNQNIQFESWAQNVCKLTKDFREGVAAFMEGREPKFKGVAGQFE